MTRAERRRQKLKKKPAVYNLTMDQINDIYKKHRDLAINEALDEAVDKASAEVIAVLFSLPLKVLMENQWKDSPTLEEDAAKFTTDVLELYDQWCDGKLSIEAVQDEIWNTCGFKLQQVDD